MESFALRISEQPLAVRFSTSLPDLPGHRLRARTHCLEPWEFTTTTTTGADGSLIPVEIYGATHTYMISSQITAHGRVPRQRSSESRHERSNSLGVTLGHHHSIHRRSGTAYPWAIGTSSPNTGASSILVPYNTAYCDGSATSGAALGKNSAYLYGKDHGHAGETDPTILSVTPGQTVVLEVRQRLCRDRRRHG